MDPLKWWQRVLLSEKLPPSPCSKLAMAQHHVGPVGTHRVIPDESQKSEKPWMPWMLSLPVNQIWLMNVDDIEFCSGQTPFRDICFFGVPRGGFHQDFPTMFKHIPRFSKVFTKIFTKIFQGFHPPYSPHRWKETPIFGPALRDDRNADRALDANKLCADTRLARWPERSTWGAVPRGSAGNFKEWKGWNVGKMSLESSQISSQEKDRTWNLAQVIEKQRRFLDVKSKTLWHTHTYI